MKAKSEDVSSPFRQLRTGANIPAYDGHSLDKPPVWLDKDKLRRGQEFVQKYFFQVMFCHFCSALCTFTWSPIFQLMTYTRKMETVDKAFQRSMDSMEFIRSWYEGDMWNSEDKSYLSMKMVQDMHKSIGAVSNRNKCTVYTSRVNTSNEPKVEGQCTFWSLVQKDMGRLPSIPPKIEFPEDRCFISQLDSAAVVLGTIGPLLTNQKKFGVHGASDKDLEGFLHLWQVIGYHIGIQDKFNPCGQGLEHFRTIYSEFLESVLHPALKTFCAQDEFSSRITMEGARQYSVLPSLLGVNCESVLLYGLWIADIHLPSFYRSMAWYDKLHFVLIKFTATVIMRVPLVRIIMNVITKLEVYRLLQIRKMMK